jgi:hypothetical protein
MKVKLFLCLINEANYTSYQEDIWRSEDVAPSLLTSTLDGGEWSASQSYHFISREGAHWYTLQSVDCMGRNFFPC